MQVLGKLFRGGVNVRSSLWYIITVLFVMATNVLGVTLYVDASRPDDSGDGLSWATAKQTIQAAVDAAGTNEALIRVTNGTYNVGTTVTPGANLSNRVCAVGPMTIRSENGPEFTIIEGAADSATNYYKCAGIRGAYLAEGAQLVGFTISNGHTHLEGFFIPIYPATPTYNMKDLCGGGVYCDSMSSVSNCVFAGNEACYEGGGLYGGTARNCSFRDGRAMVGGGAASSILYACMMSSNKADGLRVMNVNGKTGQSWIEYYGGGGAISYSTANGCLMIGNQALDGGSADRCELNNCSVYNNKAERYGGGIYRCSANNSIIYDNITDKDPRYYNYSSGTSLNYCCTWPMPTSGVGNIVSDPCLYDLCHLSSASPCIGAGSSAYIVGTDIDGDPWLDPPDIGCDQYTALSATGTMHLSISTIYTNIAIRYEMAFNGHIAGHSLSNRWDFGDGTCLTNRLNVTHHWNQPGTYQVYFTAFNQTYPEGVSAQLTIVVAAENDCIRYVALDSPTPAPPYTTWETAAHTIQEAVDASSVPGTMIHVSNGCYNAGTATAPGYNAKNRLCVTGPFVVQSVNGPDVTIIEGAPDLTGGIPSNGVEAVRGVFLSYGAEFIGFTVTNGYTQTGKENSDDGCGAGIYCEGECVIKNCIISCNTAYQYGGGIYGEDADVYKSIVAGNISLCRSAGGVAYSTLHNCKILDNTATWSGGGLYRSKAYGCLISGNRTQDDGGGAYCGLLYNCTIVDNTALGSGGGAFDSILGNCIVFYNKADTSENLGGTDISAYYCCVGTCGDYFYYSYFHNIFDPPLLMSETQLGPDSPCISSGLREYCVGTDIEGDAWLDPPSIGCDQFLASGYTGELVVAVSAKYTANAYDCALPFTARITGRAFSNVWSFDDGAFETNQFLVTHAWTETGRYEVVLTVYNEDYPNGISATQVVTIGQYSTTHYVSQNSPSPQYPYSSWETAAHTIQEAVDAAPLPHAIVYVDDGHYNTGTKKPGPYILYSRVYLDNMVTVQSVNGPEVTFIEGMADTDSGSLGPSAIRGVCMGTKTVLIGFTITNGYTLAGSTGSEYDDLSAGGIYCSGGSCIISNCIITGNQGGYDAGGVFQGTLYNCTISGNRSYYGGGGVYWCTLYNCVLSGNTVVYHGGGAFESILNGCLLKNNHTGLDGGGAFCGTLNNCTLVGNTASNSGGGTFYATQNNCILWDNTCEVSDASLGNYNGGTFNYCCSVPIPTNGENNIASNPLFLDAANGHYQLQTTSPCRNTGNNAYVPTKLSVDLAGNPRIAFDLVDMGAYERLFDGYMIFVHAGPHGRVDPADDVIEVENNGSASFTFIPDEWFEMGDVLIDGVSIGTATHYDWDNLAANGTVDVSFAETYVPDCPRHMPNYWMGRYGLTNNMVDQVDQDQDGDGLSAWQEYVMDTDPTNRNSMLTLHAPNKEPGHHTLQWQASAGRRYTVYSSTNLLGGFTNVVMENYQPASSGPMTITNETGEAADTLYYRVKVALP